MVATSAESNMTWGHAVQYKSTYLDTLGAEATKSRFKSMDTRNMPAKDEVVGSKPYPLPGPYSRIT